MSKKAARWKTAVPQQLDSSQTTIGSKPSQSSPPLNQKPQSVDVQKALRFVLLHLLAIQPIAVKAIIQQTRCKKEDCLDILRKIGKQTSPTTDEWQLTEKAYKELDVWAFHYPSQELRQSVIDNTIRVYDRLRISPEDQQWQILLPKHDRGKGIILSKLKLNVQPNKPPRKMTPIIKPSKKQLPQKKSGKPLAAEDEEETSAADEETEFLGKSGGRSVNDEGQDPAKATGGTTTAQGTDELPGRDIRKEMNKAVKSQGSDKPTVEVKAPDGAKKTALDAEKKRKIAEGLKGSDRGKEPFAMKEKSAGETTLAKGETKVRDKAEAKRSLTPANQKSIKQVKSPKPADKKSEKRSHEDPKTKSNVNGRPSYQNSPKEPVKKSEAAATPRPFTTHWQPRKDPPVIRKGPKNPASRRPSQNPVDKNNVKNNACQDRDSTRRLSTKPKVPSPLGTEPMVNTPEASPMTKSPAAQSISNVTGNSDVSLKRKVNDLDAKDDGFRAGGDAPKYRKTNNSTSSLSSLSSQATNSSAGQVGVSAGLESGEKSLKRKPASSEADHVTKSPSKQRRVEVEASTSRIASANSATGKYSSVGNNSQAPAKSLNGPKPLPKATPKVPTSTAASSATKSSKAAATKFTPKPGSTPQEERTADHKAVANSRARHSSSNSTSTVSSTASDSNVSNATSMSATAPALTSASTSASDSDADEGKTCASPLRMSFRQTVEHARKFQKYYIPYAELYERLSSSPDPPSEKDRATLMGMHEKLSVMKTEIKSGALRQE